MIDVEHPVVKRLVALGYRLALHVYLRNGKIKTTIAAKHPESGKLLQGWSKDGSLDGALQNLAARSGLMAGHTV